MESTLEAAGKGSPVPWELEPANARTPQIGRQANLPAFHFRSVRLDPSLGNTTGSLCLIAGWTSSHSSNEALKVLETVVRLNEKSDSWEPELRSPAWE